jgi:uncharacterized protein
VRRLLRCCRGEACLRGHFPIPKTAGRFLFLSDANILECLAHRSNKARIGLWFGESASRKVLRDFRIGSATTKAKGYEDVRQSTETVISMSIDLRDPTLDAQEVRLALNLQAHPEGGHYRELWRDSPAGGGRGAASSILFLLSAGERSRWHRIDACEIWIWQAGAPLLLGLSHTDGQRQTVKLGPNAREAETLQGFVPPYAWQEASSLGAWTLVSCIVAPAFQFEGFELSPSDTPGV